MPVILVVKYGLVSSAALLIPIVLWVRSFIKGEIRNFRKSFSFLILLVFLVHFVVISVVKFRVTWYPLAIFPFLYLPFVWMWLEGKRRKSAKIIIMALVCMCVVFLDNGYRYVKWYPYGHFDGAQYGREHIGWTKSAMVSFEALPFLYAYMSELERREFGLSVSEKISVNCQVSYAPQANRYLMDVLSGYFRMIRNDDRFEFLAEKTDGVGESPLLLTSAVYNPTFEEGLLASEYTMLKMISVKGIDIFSLWRKE